MTRGLFWDLCGQPHQGSGPGLRRLMWVSAGRVWGEEGQPLGVLRGMPGRKPAELKAPPSERCREKGWLCQCLGPKSVPESFTLPDTRMTLLSVSEIPEMQSLLEWRCGAGRAPIPARSCSWAQSGATLGPRGGRSSTRRPCVPSSPCSLVLLQVLCLSEPISLLPLPLFAPVSLTRSLSLSLHRFESSLHCV